MKKGDKPLELAKNSDGGIYSEAHHRYSFSFQEYVSGFIKAAHVIARHIEWRRHTKAHMEVDAFFISYDNLGKKTNIYK